MAEQAKDVMQQIKEMLQSIEKTDPNQYNIVLKLLQEVMLEYTSGNPRNIEGKLYDMIDGETYETKKKK